MMKKSDLKSMPLIYGNMDCGLVAYCKAQNITAVYVMEGRPTLLAAQAQIKQLHKAGIKATLIADNMVGFLFFHDAVTAVFLSVNEHNSNGALCPIGASILGILAQRHQVSVQAWPSIISAKPLMGASKDLVTFQGTRVAPRGVKAYVPLWEWISPDIITTYH